MNYKLRYNGLYIRNSKSKENRRIALVHDFYTGPIFWIISDSLLIRKNIAYPINGLKKSKAVIKGDILAIAKEN
jgi:hypothetical protein